MPNPNDGMQEVKKLREVPGIPEHCGVKMKKMQGAPMGEMKTVFYCEKCGAQERVTAA